MKMADCLIIFEWIAVAMMFIFPEPYKLFWIIMVFVMGIPAVILYLRGLRR